MPVSQERMKIYYFSDPHINFHVRFTTNQEKFQERTRQFVRDHFVAEDASTSTLVVAGDFSELNQQSFWMIEELSLHYKYLVMTFGNHDHYLPSKTKQRQYQASINRILELKAQVDSLPNAFALLNDTITLDGVTFAGTRLWYNPTSDNGKWFFQYCSNDSRYIFGKHSESKSDWFEPKLTLCEDYHETDQAFYNSLGEVDVMVTHVPPFQPNNGREYNECYVTPVNELKAEHWICGHQHEQGTFLKADTTFYMNPVGYDDESTWQHFELRWFEVAK